VIQFSAGALSTLRYFIVFLTLLIYISVAYFNELKMSKMGKACGTCGGEDMCMQDIGGEMLGKETTWNRSEDNIKIGVKSVRWDLGLD
jgi:hypothetical protein